MSSADWTVTFFTNFAASEKREETLPPEQLLELIRATDANIKGNLPWLKLATFGEQRTQHGSLRHDANLLSVTGVEADFDAESMSFDDAVEIAEKAGLHCIVYTEVFIVRTCKRLS